MSAARTAGRIICGMFSNLDVLVVDDSAPVRGYLARVLEKQGNRVVNASSAVEAREAWEKKTFDLVMLDILLPDTDGLELLSELRKRNTETCIVMVTGHAGIRSAIQAAQMGADGYINKNDIVGSQESMDELLHQLDQSLTVRAGHRTRAELERMRSDLYAMVSHDLRNPINAIQLAAGSIVEDFEPDDMTQDVRMLAQTIVKNADTLLRQLNDFLDFSKLDAGMFRLFLDRNDIGTLTETVVDQMRPLAHKRGHKIVLAKSEVRLFANVDSRRIEQVLANLITNAIKYTVEPGEIRVNLRPSDSTVAVAITDTGIGIPEDELPKLFTRYGRGKSEAVRKIQGTGLGLLIVKQIVEAHGGRVWAESVEGKGSTFALELPRLPSEN